jgi:hypothetical protein
MVPAKSDRVYAGVLQNGLCTIFSRSATSVRPAHGRTIQSRTRYVSPLPVLDQYGCMCYLANHRVSNSRAEPSLRLSGSYRNVALL